ncbi:fibroblast growth factor 23-like [Centropristis striata]|uniref:fibroblast growth factor 23-like n=1 Tax=Centropristis striata TaxID=184440 RepID=UPI0027E0A358|nr:fibroblast growth factor 23-like [Centropristis striata]
MQPAFFSLILTAVHVSVRVDCTPRPRGPETLLQPEQSSSTTGAHDPSYTSTGRFHWELSGSGRKGIHRHFLVILPVRTDTSNFVSIFDLRRKRFLCMDSKGELYNSRQKDREDCLFQRIWLDLNHHDVFYSMSGNRLLKLDGAELRVASQEPAEVSSGLVQRFLGPLVKRQRRSEEVNPSDPLRSQSHPSPSAKDHQDNVQPDQDQAGSQSKETIASSDDDPLRVLQPNGPGSPVKNNIADRAEQA